jgi:hypothetical protein
MAASKLVLDAMATADKKERTVDRRDVDLFASRMHAFNNSLIGIEARLAELEQRARSPVRVDTYPIWGAAAVVTDAVLAHIEKNGIVRAQVEAAVQSALLLAAFEADKPRPTAADAFAAIAAAKRMLGKGKP